jgi:hypothetical protein
VRYHDGIIEAGILFHFTNEEQNQILQNIISILKPKGRFLSYYPQGINEGMQEMNVSGETYKRYTRQLRNKNWISQARKIGFAASIEYEFNFGVFKCVEFIK